VAAEEAKTKTKTKTTRGSGMILTTLRRGRRLRTLRILATRRSYNLLLLDNSLLLLNILL
jgi:hypothetical protein